MAVDWLKIRNEYVSGGGSYQKLAQKHSVCVSAIKRRASTEDWTGERAKRVPKVYQKTIEKTAEKIAEREACRTARILTLADRLSDKLEQAITELDSHLVVNKHKTRTIAYTDPSAPGKPTKEVIDEREDGAVVQSLVDRRGLQQVAAALKNINDVLNASDKPVADTSLMQELLNVVADNKGNQQGGNQ